MPTGWSNILPRIKTNQWSVGDIRYLSMQCGNHASGLWKRRPLLICHPLLRGGHDRYLPSEGHMPHITATDYKIPRVAAAYARILEGKVLYHRLIERMGAAHWKSKSRALARRHLNKLDKELGQYMRYAEKKCCKIKSGWIPFSPEASLWICRTQVYQSFLRLHAGWIKN
jgi:hypothetical protein